MKLFRAQVESKLDLSWCLNQEGLAFRVWELDTCTNLTRENLDRASQVFVEEINVGGVFVLVFSNW